MLGFKGISTSQQSIKIPKINSAPTGPNLSAALAKHIMFMRKQSKIKGLPKSVLGSLPAVLRG